jgi:excisionase family DNA binding protein
MAANPKTEVRRAAEEISNASAVPSQGVERVPMRFLTRFELAEALKVSVRTVDTMLAGGEIPHLRVHGNFVRFYLPDVVRHLSATALVSKRRWAGRRRSAECRVQSAECRKTEPEVLQKEAKRTKVSETLRIGG